MANAQKKAAKDFADFWEGRGYEKGHAQTFWNMLLRDVFGISNPEIFIEYEDQVLMDESTGFIDGYIPSSKVLIEQKSLEKDLSKAIRQSDGSLLSPFQQAKKYIVDLPVDRHPRWVITCNFKEFNIYDMNNPKGEPEVILLKDLPKEYHRLSFLVDTENVHLKKEMELSLKAGDIVGELYDAFSEQYNDLSNQYSVESLNKLCVRVVFCLYAEDAELFKRKNQFHDYLSGYEARDMRQALIDLFKVLDTPENQRSGLYLPDAVLDFPYVNGGLFSDDDIEIPLLTDRIKDLLLAKASDDFNWSDISPTIFGAVFESTLNPETRRSGGMHYTSIENIHKVIDPLFLDELNEEFEEIKNLKQKSAIDRRVSEFQDKLSKLTFLDPAAGSGNFLTETYICLRTLENEALKLAFGSQMTLIDPIKVSISQFYGIEINDFAVAVAQTALWIAESQMMKETEEIFNINLSYLPLKEFDNIREENALTLDWGSLIKPAELNYIIGNPPFVGYGLQNERQKKEILSLYVDEKGKAYKTAGKIDYVAGWYMKACQYMQGTQIRAALVSTNSITQGEQVSSVWEPLYKRFNLQILFAHKTFRWDSEANIKAHVHCVIIGFCCYDNNLDKVIFENNIPTRVKQISPYLRDLPIVWIYTRKKPISNVPEMTTGNRPADGGHLIIEADDYDAFIKKEPDAVPYVKKLTGAEEYINKKERYCLWLVGVDPSTVMKMPEVMKRVELCRADRLQGAQDRQKLAQTPMLFRETKNPESYIVVPATSSERRFYIPLGFLNQDTIPTNSAVIIPGAGLYEFGVLISSTHMSWMRAVAGRLEMRYRYSKEIVYNNFPWPDFTELQKEKIEQTAQAILDARDKYPDSSLADMYGDYMYMYPDLLAAHQENDKAVMEAYGFVQKTMSESELVAELMKMYQDIVSSEQ